MLPTSDLADEKRHSDIFTDSDFSLRGSILNAIGEKTLELDLKGKGPEFWFRKAIDYGNATAAFNLANLLGQEFVGATYKCLTDKQTVDNNTIQKKELSTEIALLYLKAYENGILEAGTSYAICVARGFGVSQDPKQAFDIFKSLHEQKQTRATVYFAIALLEGNGTESNPTYAMELLDEVAQEDIAKEIPLVFHILGKQCQVEKNVKAAIEYYEKGAIASHWLCIYELVKIYEVYVFEDVKTQQEQLSKYRKLLLQHPMSKFNLSEKYLSYSLAEIYYQYNEGNLKQAQDAISELLCSYPDDLQVWLAYHLLYQYTISDIFPLDSRDQKKSLVYLHLAKFYEFGWVCPIAPQMALYCYKKALEHALGTSKAECLLVYEELGRAHKRQTLGFKSYKKLLEYVQQ